jgi:cell division protein FtsZ
LLFFSGEINVDFADVNTVMKGMGRGLLGTGLIGLGALSSNLFVGEAEGHDRAKLAALNALHNPLLEDVPLQGAKACLINIYRGSDLALTEVI